jgi:hypothetical protein
LAETKNNSVKTKYMSNINSSRERNTIMGSMSIEEYEALQSVRENTMVSSEYIQWMSELAVSSSYEDPTGRLRAREIMSSWGKRG